MESESNLKKMKKRESVSDLDKVYYKISEVADMLAIPQSTLRYWETQFVELEPHRNEAGTRFYSNADIEVLRQIKYLVHDSGLKIDAARAAMRAQPSTVEAHRKTLERLRQMRETVVGIRDALTRLR
jgi:DNA-binding transcriptional MerR regulator